MKTACPEPAEIDRAAASNRVIRGGSWNNNATNLTAANRNNNNPSNHNNNNGFRCSKTRGPLEGAQKERGHGFAPRGVP
ncbi:MAG: SUMF1/EgtB/PvdO family nonheme iron enzyme [Polyangiaceae bacterium]